MYELNPERNIENIPSFNHKTALHFKFEEKKNHRWFFFQTDNQPTVGTNVTRDTQHTGSVYNVIHCVYPFKSEFAHFHSISSQGEQEWQKA